MIIILTKGEIYVIFDLDTLPLSGILRISLGELTNGY